MTTIKITYNNEIRRKTLGAEEARGLSSFSSFVDLLKELFSPQLNEKKVSLIWFDDEGDKITVSSDSEMQEATRFMSQGLGDGKNIIRFEILAEGARVSDRGMDVVHDGVTCDECGIFPIRGLRFKCTVRDNFDLCERCESNKKQPYPMIKISDPSQSPVAVFCALRDESESGRGPQSCPWKRGGYRRFNQPGHANTAETTATAAGAGGESAGAEGPCWKRRWERRGERCGRKLRETVAPFVEAFDKFVKDPANLGDSGADMTRAFSEAVNNLTGAVAAVVDPFGVSQKENSENVASTQKEVEASLEDQLMQEVIQESLLMNEVANAFAREKLPESTATASASAASASATSASSSRVAVTQPAPTLSKPSLRFIRDVTYPDSTIVQPGTRFRKIWKVRNDGAQNWPDGVVLVPAGGDLMCPENIKEPLPAVATGEEVEIGLDLRAPLSSGMHTAYFRAQTKEQAGFGHRLWATVMVNDMDDTWTAVSPSMLSDSSSQLSSPPTSTASAISVNDTVNVAATPVASVPVAVAAPSSTAMDSAPAVSAIAAVAATAALPSDAARLSTPADVSETASTTSATSSSAVPPARGTNPLHLMWRKELAALEDMGFADPDITLPLLKKHLRNPVSLSGNREAVPNQLGMERVINELISFGSGN